MPRKPSRRAFGRAVVLGVVAGLALLSVSPLAQAANGSATYTYDALGRVASVSYDTGIIIIYTYDANGNRLSQTINVNTVTLTWTATVNPCSLNCWGAALW
jgi:YD repeat-containing protein